LTFNSYCQVNTEKFRISIDSLGLSARSDIDFSLMSGNTDFAFLGTNTRLNYNWGKDYTFLILNGGFGRNKGVNFFSQAFLHLRNVNSLNDFVQLEDFIQYDNNKQILLLNRWLFGLGFRFKVVDTDKIQFKIGPSVFYELEDYDVGQSTDVSAKERLLRMSVYFTALLILEDNLSLLTTSYVQPAAKNLKDFRFLSDNALNIKLGKTVDLVLKLQTRFDNQPIPGIKKFDLVSKIGVAINL
jgi:putative salt-induced outer membrane protein YdiY